MRVVCVCGPGDGHFRPLLPIARALKSAGHEVLFATGPDFRHKVREQGFELHPAGLTFADGNHEFSSRYDRGALTPNEIALFLFGRTFAPPLARDLVSLFDSWRPDLVIHEEGDYSAPIAAGVGHSRATDSRIRAMSRGHRRTPRHRQSSSEGQSRRPEVIRGHGPATGSGP